MLRKLVRRVNDAKYFAILCDETTDIRAVTQLSFCVRFIESNKIYEEFLQFVPVTDCTGLGLANSICEGMKDMGLNTEHLVGQGYDGANAMSGALRGTQAFVRKNHPKALYVHCCSHSFNLSLSEGCNIPEMRNCFGVIETVYNFFKYPKRMHILELQIDKLQEKPRSEKLKRLCPTSWIERHDSVRAFIELLDPLLSALIDISDWNDKKVATDAHLLLSAVCKCDFLICLFCTESVFDLTLPLSKYLQTENIDLNLAVKSATNVQKTLQNYRCNVNEIFSNIFLKVSTLCDKHEINISRPRIAGRQTHRQNIPSESVEKYYKRAIFIPFLDVTIQSINQKFVNHRDILSQFQNFLETSESDGVINSIEKLNTFYNLTDETIVGEIHLWQQFLNGLDKKPDNALSALEMCNKNMFPVIYKLLSILATLPVTTCTCERSFSSLKFLKSYLRNSTGEERLNGLAMMFVHESVSVSEEEVLDELSLKRRKLNILL